MHTVGLTTQFLKRELRSRFLGSFSGGLWALIQPLIQLAVYSFVFVHVFKAKLPDANGPGYVPFLVVALWPWTAFSEAIQRATMAIQEHAALIGKVALPREVLVFASVGASFLVHIVGFVVIVSVLWLSGASIVLSHLPLALMLYCLLFGLACGLALLFAALQVFVRDLAQMLIQLLTLMMFAAPVFYDRAMLPEPYQQWVSLNPFTFYAEGFRSLLLDHGLFNFISLAIASGIAMGVLALGHFVFHRLDPHFEDFL